MADLASAWLGGSQQAIDYAWRRHTADLQMREEERKAKEFAYQEDAWNKAQQYMQPATPEQLAGLLPVGAEAPTAALPAAPQGPLPGQGAPPASLGAQPTGAAQPTAQTQTAPAPTVQRLPFTTPLEANNLQPPTVYQQQFGQAAPQDTTALQQRLIELGYMTPQQVATGPGVYGPRTTAAVQQFQQERGLPVTGQYDAATQEAMNTQYPGAQPLAPGEMLAPEVNVTASPIPELVTRKRVEYVPAEAVQADQPTVENGIPSQVPMPTAPTPEAVQQAVSQFTQDLQRGQEAYNAEREWRRLTRAREVAAIASRMPLVGFRAAMGNAVIDVPSLMQTYNQASEMYAKALVNNGELPLLDAIAISEGYSVSVDGNGNYRLAMPDQEQQLTHEFGISRPQAAVVMTLFDIGAQNGGTISIEDAREYMPILAAFPSIFQYRDGNSRDILTDENGNLMLNQSFLAKAQARYDQVTDSKQMLAAQRNAVAQMNATGRWYDTFDKMVQRYDNGMPENVAQNLANQYNSMTGGDYTAADIQAQWAAARYTPEMEEQAKARGREQAAQIARDLEQIRQNNRLSLAEKRGAIAASLRRLGASLTPRRGGTGRGTAAGAADAGVATRQVVTEENRAAFEAMRPVVTSLIARIDNEDDNEMFAQVFAEGTPARAALDAFKKDNVSTNIAGAIPTVRNLQLMRTIHGAIADAGASDLFDFSGAMLDPTVQVGTGRNAVYNTVTPAGGSAAGSLRVGQVEDGYRYIGGDPGNQSSWEPI